MKRYVIRFCQMLFITSLVAAMSLALIYSFNGKLQRVAASARDSLTHTSKASKEQVTMQQKQTFIQAVQSAAENYPSVQTGVSYIDLDTGEQTDAGETAAFTAASTTKVLTAAAYMHLVEDGQARLDTIIGGSTAQQLIQRMLNISDNSAWSTLNDYIGHTALQQYAISYGLSSYDVNSNTITAHDQAQLLAKLYKNQLTTSSHTKILLSYMQDTNNEDLIPAALPAQATVYHKYGYLGGELHDSAIISYQGHTFALVIFTKNNNGTLDDYNERTTLFHAITTAALSYAAN